MFTSFVSDPLSHFPVLQRQAAYRIGENTTRRFNSISSSHRLTERPRRLTKSFYLRIDVNNIQPSNVSMDELEWTSWCYCRATKCLLLLSRVSSAGKVPDIFCHILTKPGTSQQIFVEIPDFKFYENPSRGSRTDTRG